MRGGEGRPAEVAGGEVALVRILGERLGEHLVERRRKVGAACRDARRLIVDVSPQRRHVAVAPERRLAGQGFVEEAPERVHVGAGVGPTVRDLLGRDVVDGADEGAGACGAGPGSIGALGQAEVGEVGVLVAVALLDEHVGRLDIPVNEPARVGGVERLGDLRDDGGGPLRVDRALLDDRGEIVTLHERHRQEQETVVLARLVDGQDVGVAQPCRRASFVAEALGEVAVAGELRGDQLQRDGPVQRKLRGPVDLAHAAAADRWSTL